MFRGVNISVYKPDLHYDLENENARAYVYGQAEFRAEYDVGHP